jgi:hypothetical protein
MRMGKRWQMWPSCCSLHLWHMDYSPDGGAVSYYGPKGEPKGGVPIQGGLGFCPSPCDYGSLMSPAMRQFQKLCHMCHWWFFSLMGAAAKLFSTFQLGIFKMSGLFVLPL